MPASKAINITVATRFMPAGGVKQWLISAIHMVIAADVENPTKVVVTFAPQCVGRWDAP